MEQVDFEKLLDELSFLTDDQLNAVAFTTWVLQSERYHKDAAATASTSEDGLQRYEDKHGI